MAGAGALAIAGLALANHALARRAERSHPARGRFITVDGVRLHYLEQGSGPAIVLLHGNGAMAEDFVISGVLERLAHNHRVIAFDRPGFGFSERPRSRVWAPDAQAALFEQALSAIGVTHPVIVGHSWGTLVAVAMALRPARSIRGLVLLSGYYYPTVRADTATSGWPAVPLFGDALRYTISPLFARLFASAAYRKLFAPSRVTERFQREFPTEMAVRPSQIRASAAETALMVPSAAILSSHYAELTVPIALMAGTEDGIANFERQSERFAAEVPNSTLYGVPGVGHMLHHVVPDRVAAIIAETAQESRDAGNGGSVQSRADQGATKETV